MRCPECKTVEGKDFILLPFEEGYYCICFNCRKEVSGIYTDEDLREQEEYRKKQVYEEKKRRDKHDDLMATNAEYRRQYEEAEKSMIKVHLGLDMPAKPPDSAYRFFSFGNLVCASSVKWPDPDDYEAKKEGDK